MADTPMNEVNVPDDLDDFESVFYDKKAKLPETEAEETPDEPEADEAEADQDEVDPVDTEADEDAEAEAEDDGTEEEDEEGEDQPEITLPKKNRKSAKERINELTTEKYAEKARADELLRRVTELEGRLTKSEKEEEVPQARKAELDGKAPAPDDRREDGELVYPMGEFDPKFIADLTRHVIAKETGELKAKNAEEARARVEQEEADRLMTAHETRLSEAEKDYSDIRPKIATLEAEFSTLDPQFGVFLAQTIMGMDLGPHVLYYLANNVGEARQIVASGPTNATLALGRLEARIQSAMNKEQKATPAVRQSNAPPPVVTSRGSGVRVAVNPDTDDLDAFEHLFFVKKKR